MNEIPNSQNMTKCKVCGADIAKSAPTCPKCGAVLRRRIGFLGWAGIVVGSIIASFFTLLIIIFIFAEKVDPQSVPAETGIVEESTVGEKAEDPVKEAAEAPQSAPVESQVEEPKEEPLFPKTQNCGDWNITVTGTTFAKEELLETNDDSRLLAVKTTVINNGKKTDYFVLPIGGTITCFVKYKDYKYEHTWLSSVENTVNGQQLNPLEKASGLLLFSLPETVIKDAEEPLYLVFVEGKKTAEFRVR